MTNVSFEEETYQTPQAPLKGAAGFAGVIMRFGLAKNEKEANRFLLWTAIIGCVLAAGLFIQMFVNEPKGLSDQDIERIIKLQQQ